LGGLSHTARQHQKHRQDNTLFHTSSSRCLVSKKNGPRAHSRGQKIIKKR